jgi:glycerol-3-phosphate dehydrogenase
MQRAGFNVPDGWQWCRVDATLGGVTLRDANIRRMRDGHFDVLVVGAGINGAVSAASLAGRGASVALIDRGDFGSFTSQESSNLVWGGFKYLENYELPLVFGLCRSRNRLMKAYPDNIKEIGFLAALDRGAPYPPWFAAVGATAYWVIGLFGTKPPKLFDADSHQGAPSRRSTRAASAAASSTRTPT